jgi:hypothetical protein
MPRFGATTCPTDYGLSVVDLARAVEERGLDSIFFNEHTHIPVSRRTAFPGGGELPKEYSHTHDPFVALAAQRTAQSDAFKRAHQAHLSALGGAERCSPWSCRRRCCAYLEASDE